MTGRPYTDDDLRAEAARQIKHTLDNLDTDGLLEASTYELGDGQRWEQLDERDWREALREVDELLDSAADVSRWAIDLGAGGLTPRATHGWLSTTGSWEVAVQIATSDELTESARNELIAEIRKALDETVGRVLGGTIIGRRNSKTT